MARNDNKISPHFINCKKQIEASQTVIFHLPFTSRDMSRKTIQTHYHNTMEQNTPSTCDIRTYSGTPSKFPMRIKKLTIAYSRTSNLFDTLCSSTLREHTSTVTEILNSLNAETHG